MKHADMALIGCVKTKRDGTHPAERLYDSHLFDGRKTAARERADEWRILSAEHGLLHPKAEITNYNTHISDVDGETWAENVAEDLFHNHPELETILILAGRGYVHPLQPHLHAHNVELWDPLEGVGLFDQPEALRDLATRTEQSTL